MLIFRKAIKFIYKNYTFYFRMSCRIGHFYENIVNDCGVSFLWKQYIIKKYMIKLKL